MQPLSFPSTQYTSRFAGREFKKHKTMDTVPQKPNVLILKRGYKIKTVALNDNHLPHQTVYSRVFEALKQKAGQGPRKSHFEGPARQIFIALRNRFANPADLRTHQALHSASTRLLTQIEQL